MPTPMSSSYPRPASTVLVAWFLCLGVDLFLHGGLLARLYLTPGPLILEAEEAFRRIPLGYAAFLLLAVALYWLLRRLDVRGTRSGWWHGFLSGFVLWGALALGLYSITTAGAALLAAWWLGQAVELGLAGAVIGARAAGVSLRRAWLVVGATVIALVILTVVLQSLGWSPAMAGPSGG